ncbi:MAG TPA: SurA N-terminal domain-containing protein [Terriglobales bacterium]
MALVLPLLLAGCHGKESGSDVMAKVNGRPITQAEVDKYYQSQVSGSPQQLTGEQASSFRLSILRNLIENEILIQQAERLKLLATDEEVASKLTELKAPFTQEEFKKKLEERHITDEDFKRDLRRQLTIEKLWNKEISSKISVTDQDIANYYNENKAEFNLIEPQYHLAQIMVTNQGTGQSATPRNAKGPSDVEARKKIQMILNRLQSGEDFAALASSYSEQANTAANGGDMGFIPESQIKTDSQAFDAISKLKAGQNTGILPVYEAPGSHHVIGYSIIKVISREPAGQRELNDPRVQQAIREQLRSRREQLIKAAYLDVLHNEAKVQNYYAEQILKQSGISR